MPIIIPKDKLAMVVLIDMKVEVCNEVELKGKLLYNPTLKKTKDKKDDWIKLMENFIQE